MTPVRSGLHEGWSLRGSLLLIHNDDEEEQKKAPRRWILPRRPLPRRFAAAPPLDVLLLRQLQQLQQQVGQRRSLIKAVIGLGRRPGGHQSRMAS